MAVVLYHLFARFYVIRPRAVEISWESYVVVLPCVWRRSGAGYSEPGVGRQMSSVSNWRLFVGRRLCYWGLVQKNVKQSSVDSGVPWKSVVAVDLHGWRVHRWLVSSAFRGDDSCSVMF